MSGAMARRGSCQHVYVLIRRKRKERCWTIGAAVAGCEVARLQAVRGR